MSRRIDIWIDCDPGIDDAVALAVASASRDVLDIHGISAVAGNQTSDLVTANALALSSFLGMDDVPVSRGAAGPLIRAVSPAGHVHGGNGLGGVELPPTKKALAPGGGIGHMRDAIMALPDGRKMTLVATGPLTDIALLLRAFPEVRDKVERIVSMGGSTAGGNISPSAEFNIWTDPEAAAMVYADEVPVVMCGLDVTLRCGLTRGMVATLQAAGSSIQRALGEMLRFYFDSPQDRSGDIVHIHDAVTVLYLTDSWLFHGEDAGIAVDCSVGPGRGMTRRVGDVAGMPSGRDMPASTAGSNPSPGSSATASGAPVHILTDVDGAAFQRVLMGKLQEL